MLKQRNVPGQKNLKNKLENTSICEKVRLF